MRKELSLSSAVRNVAHNFLATPASPRSRVNLKPATETAASSGEVLSLSKEVQGWRPNARILVLAPTPHSLPPQSCPSMLISVHSSY